MVNKLLDAFSGSLAEDNTGRAYKTAIARIRRWYKDVEKRDTVEVKDLVKFKQWLDSEGLADNTQTIYLTVMRKVLRYGVAVEMIAPDLQQKAEVLYTETNGGRVVFNRRRINNDDIQAVLGYYRSLQEPVEAEKRNHRIARLTFNRTRAMVFTIEDTGLRITELLNLNRREFDEFLASWDGENDFILPIIGKGSKIRDVIFGKKSLTKISEYLAQRGPDNYEPLFLSHGNRGKGGRPVRQTVNNILKEVSEKLGLPGSFLSPHAYRHYFGDRLSVAGVTLEDRQDLMGHQSPLTTKKVYTHTGRTSQLQQAKRKALSDDE